MSAITLKSIKGWMKKSLVVVTLIAMPIAHAGAYEDFFAAIKADDTKALVNLLFRGFDPNTVDPDGVSGLVLAAREGSLKAADLLLSQNKTKIELRTPQDENALMMAALGGHTQLAKVLIDKGADVNKPGWTPLHYAATKGHVVILKMLLEKHAYIDAESPNKTTPLMMAAMYGTPEAVKLLIEEGADSSLKNEQGLTALDFAQRASRSDSIKLLEQAQKAEQALKAPPPPKPKAAW
jgi:uncharacterized protein